MTMSGTPESFEQLISAAMASSDYKPVWARFVRTRFFAPMHKPAESAAAELRVLPGQKDGKPLLLVTQEREKLAADSAPDAPLLSGAEIVRQLAPGVAIGVVLAKGVFTIPAKLVDSIRAKLEAAPAAPSAPPPRPPAPASPAAMTTAPHSSNFPTLHSPLPDLSLPSSGAAASATTSSATQSAISASGTGAGTAGALPVIGNRAPAVQASSFPALPGLASPPLTSAPAPSASDSTPAAAADWDDDLVDMDLLPSTKPEPAAAPAPVKPATRAPVPASSQWQILGDDHAAPAAPPATAAASRPLAPLAPVGGKKPTRPLDVQALKPRNVVHAGSGMDFYVPDAWQQRTGSRSLTFFDPASEAKIEVNSMPRSDTPLEKWLEIRLPTVTKEMPFLQQVGDSYAISGPEWRGKISAMVTEFKGTYHLDQDETHYLICCYRTDSMVATITVRVKSDVFEENRAIYKWLFEQVDIAEPMPVTVAGSGGNSANSSTDHAPAPALFGMSTTGRIGRLRFLAYSMVMYLPFFALGFLFSVLPGGIGVVIGLIMALAIIWLPIRLIVLRMHDFNMSGKWLWIFFLLSGAAGAAQRPDLSLQISALFWLSMIPVSCWPGDRQENNYGEPCEPNPLWVKIVAGLFFAAQLLLVVGVVKYSKYRSAMLTSRGAANSPSGDDAASQSDNPFSQSDKRFEIKTFTPTDKSFSVDLPGTPSESSEPPRQRGIDSMKSYQLRANSHNYLIQSMVFSKVPDDRTALLNQVRDNFLQDTRKVLVSEEPVTSGELSGREIRIKLPDGRYQYIRMMFVGSHLYVLLIQAPDGREDNPRVQAFFDSFHLN